MATQAPLILNPLRHADIETVLQHLLKLVAAGLSLLLPWIFPQPVFFAWWTCTASSRSSACSCTMWIQNSFSVCEALSELSFSLAFSSKLRHSLTIRHNCLLLPQAPLLPHWLHCHAELTSASAGSTFVIAIPLVSNVADHGAAVVLNL